MTSPAPLPVDPTWLKLVRIRGAVDAVEGIALNLGFSKERRLEPQITIGVLTEAYS